MLEKLALSETSSWKAFCSIRESTVQDRVGVNGERQDLQSFVHVWGEILREETAGGISGSESGVGVGETGEPGVGVGDDGDGEGDGEGTVKVF